MTPERFVALAEAYGGDFARWPATEREAAAAWASEHQDAARAILERAADLDALLNAAAAPQASAIMADRIVAGAPRKPGSGHAAWWLPVGMGAGLAAACAAGVVVGLQFSQPSVSEAEAVLAAVSEGLELYSDEGA
ncbi:MAG: hypothetical protein ACOY5Y_06105 [Pseudomonadota bacterium]|jgi:ferric-dicitrate binding protein FerR (iron transport regulator)